MILSNQASISTATDVTFDNSGTGLSAATVQDALTELDSAGEQLRRKIPLSDLTVASGFFIQWIQLRLKNNITFRLENEGTLRAG